MLISNAGLLQSLHALLGIELLDRRRKLGFGDAQAGVGLVALQAISTGRAEAGAQVRC